MSVPTILPFAFILLASLSAVNTQYYDGFYNPNDQDSCSSMNGEVGTCVPVRDCRVLGRQLRQQNQQQAQYIMRRYSCGFRGGVPYVCCPGEPSPWEQQLPPTGDTWTWPQPTRPSPRPEQRPPMRPDQRPPTRPDQWPPTRPDQRPPTRPDQRPPTRPSQRPPTRPDQRPRPTPSATPSKITAKPPTATSATTQSGHKNRRLLPEDSCGIVLDAKILGGTTAGIDELPWMALIQYTFSTGTKTFGCGGSLISAQYVLTAAHCVKGPDLPSNLKLTAVRLGEFDTNKTVDCQGSKCSDPPQDIPVEQLIVHEKYIPKQPAQYNDIALIRLRRKATFNEFVSPICLPMDQVARKDYEGTSLLVAGWGRTRNQRGSSSTTKQKLGIPVVSKEVCAPFYKSNKIELRNTQMCAGGEENKDSCSGDSGGPLMSTDVVNSQVRWHVTGIVSFGPTNCGLKDIAAVYTKVSEYINWILDNMKD